jgi:hypothetical protein
MISYQPKRGQTIQISLTSADPAIFLSWQRGRERLRQRVGRVGRRATAGEGRERGAVTIIQNFIFFHNVFNIKFYTYYFKILNLSYNLDM